MGEGAVEGGGEVVSGAPPAVVRRLASTKPLMTAVAATENVVARRARQAWRVFGGGSFAAGGVRGPPPRKYAKSSGFSTRIWL